MISRKEWKEFRVSGMLWWVNTLLHTFGWAIVLEMDDAGEITGAYPARVKFRGFDQESNEIGYFRVTEYMLENATDLLQEVTE